MSNNITTNQSKYMSWVLRHGLNDLGLKPDVEGYIKLSDFINTADANYKLNTDIILQIVESCPKQRFAIKKLNEDIFIRANQGHSKKVGELLESDKLLIKITKPITGVFHGSYKKHLESIKINGLNRMERQHIHIAKFNDAKSGKRSNCNLIVYIDMSSAMEDGIEFYESSNGVILTEGINGILLPKYLTYGEILKNGQIVSI